MAKNIQTCALTGLSNTQAGRHLDLDRSLAHIHAEKRVIDKDMALAAFNLPALSSLTFFPDSDEGQSINQTGNLKASTQTTAIKSNVHAQLRKLANPIGGNIG